VMVYQSRYDDKITSVETGERTTSNQIIVQSRNATQLDLWGIEAGAEWQFAPSWDAYATATLTRGTEKLGITQADADRIPPLFGKAGIRYELNEQVSMESYSFYATRQDRLNPRDRTDPRINPLGTAGWATFNTAINLDINDQLSVRAAVENIADRRYREHGTGLDEPGRNFVFSVDYGF
jgi:hemoglobin/transferrin/lactoferrin receptor protein